MLADPASTESGIQETERVPDLNGTKKESDKFFSNSSDSHFQYLTGNLFRQNILIFFLIPFFEYHHLTGLRGRF